jgi:hypothetical protein
VAEVARLCHSEKGGGFQTRHPVRHKYFCINDLQEQKWRRRESNPQADPSNDLRPNELGKGHSCESVNASQSLSTNGDFHALTTSGTTSCEASLCYIAAHWQHLPPHIREAICTLVDAAIARPPAQGEL